MVEIKIYEFINCVYSNYKDKLVQVHAAKGERMNDCFEEMYSLRRSARYDPARKYRFEDETLEIAYREWKAKNETIEMYYGSATVY